LSPNVLDDVEHVLRPASLVPVTEQEANRAQWMLRDDEFVVASTGAVCRDLCVFLRRAINHAWSR